MKPVYTLIPAGLFAALLTLAGCGGGGGGGGTVAGIGGTGKIASGTITGFGSIFVNDFEYEFDAGTSFDVDGDTTAGEIDLRVGMVVTVVAEDVVGTTGTATSVVFDDDVEGPVADLVDDGTTKRFTVLGTTVVVDAATTVFDDTPPGFTFDTLTDGTVNPPELADVVEVSGFFDANGVLKATYIENKGSFDPANPTATEAELKGTVSNAVPATGASSAGDTFDIDGITVTLLAGTDLSDVPGGVVTNGLLVEAKGVLTSPTGMDASKVEQESEGFGDDEDDVSLEGLISEFNSISDFKVAGQPVNAASAVLEPASLSLGNGLRVEVEGPIVSGVLIAEEVEAEGGDIKIDAVVSAAPGSNSVTLSLGIGPGTLTVIVDAGTEIEDEDTGDITLADIADGDFLEVRAVGDASNIIATEIRRSSDTDNDVILQGPLDAFDPTANGSITVLGIQFSTNASTDYEDENDQPLADSAAFNARVSVGDIVKIKDDDPSGAATPDTVADEIDLEN